MQRIHFLGLTAITVVASLLAVAAVADDDDYPVWKPSSDTAVSITGPIMLLPDRLKAGQSSFPWRIAGALAQFKPDQGAIPARLFEVADATNPDLLNGKKLCGGKPVGWIVMVPAPPDGLEIDAYTSVDKPSSISSPGLCGTFTYKRW
jgi:hypothetical protein